MAEAAVEEMVVEPNDIKFFCHKCAVDIPRVLDDYTCPRCLGGFIEELDGSTTTPDDGGESTDEDDNVGELELLSQINTALFGLASERNERGGGRRRRRARNRGTDRSREYYEPFEHVIQDFIVNLTGVGWGPTAQGGRGGGPVRLFLGNPGDYAWGRDGLDAIVTQLLNQMDVAGPPPLDKDKIKEIPVSAITQAQAESKLQCSICWDDFEAGEFVKKLQCEHFYHDKCIVPWLELHGTCPICRKSLTGEEENGENAEHTHLPDLASIWRWRGPRWPSTSPSTSTTSTSTSTSSTSSTTASTNSSNPREPRHPSESDMDFESVE